MSETELTTRKNQHLNIVLASQRAKPIVGSGFERLHFEHCALPELDLAGVDLSTVLFGKPLAAPLLISSMTGGARRAEAINHHLAEAAEELGIALAVGSQRVALERGGDGTGLTRELRRLAPSVPLLSNIGAAQLVQDYGVDQARRALDMIDGDALIIHLNPLQEAVQDRGDRNWRGVLLAIERLTAVLEAPLVVKEVGSGLSAQVARQLLDAGVAVLDVAGAGGTNWAAVESERAANPHQRAVAEAFANWGIPTAEAIASVRQACPGAVLIGSGGIADGIDAAKAIRLGANLVGQAAAVLESALISSEAVVEHFRVLIEQLRIVCFCTGSANLAELAQAPLLRPSF